MRFIQKILKFLFGRMFIVGALIAVQAVILAVTILLLSQQFIYVYLLFVVISLFMVFWILGRDDNPAVKLPWILVITILPVFGGLFYIIFGRSRLPKKYKQNMLRLQGAISEYYPANADAYKRLRGESIVSARQCDYLHNVTNMPVYENTVCEYLPLGEVKFKRMKQELEKAKHYIFMEYFIIEEGQMWDAILEILVRKVKEGVEVRVMYDDIGCVQTLPYNYDKKLISLGIKCTVFNPFRPSLSTSLQNRDHRKILVIDGHTGFTGGINLADEYINAYKKHGHWKDCAVMLNGEAVYSLTLMFLEMWNFYSDPDKTFDGFTPREYNKELFLSDGYVMPYGDTPLDDEFVSESIYLNIINNANEYLYINSPYFIVDNELVTALKLAAKRGVDVKIVTPHIADKWYVHIMTRSYYPILIKAGIEVFEYTPGFIHSKTFVCDDAIATVGTVNMDYRSLYHHFECGVWMYNNAAVGQLKRDFCETLKVCERITYEKSISVPLYQRVIRSVLRLLAPLM